ncbi:WD40-repeat-containing domain protein [Gamsiella multidivaricata]|uniref:WD40-repeat-containing domain protein n=1 Tax=Gamsiella multidivaricata TaxID=101098 RepID=UPI00221E694F|nr:WD40-repeat-containing domain protein [Gamsiella multidivaricata]KAI7817417.1 WD40-repeat-containing domain protein [Gamsiella multidivaricata]
MHSRSRTSRNTLSDWYDIAFICYETLYNMSSKSNQGRVSVSTLTWGSQLDISTFRLHYGSVFTPFGSQNRHPVASCLTVEMRQYGDKDSAAEVLAIRNNGHLYDSCEAMLEGINVAGRGPVMDMKCLESGHLVTSSMSTNQTNNLYVWDMRDDAEQAKVPVVALKSQLRGKIYFDACNGDVCSVDDNGTIHSYDLYTAALSNKHTDTRNLDYTAMTDIDLEYKFFSSCISINGFDSTVLVGSSEHAQIARWDPRSPSSNIFTSTACRRWGTRGSQRRDYDHIYGIEWSPRNTNEFMTVHMEAVRIWDARKMDRDIFATTHCMAPTALRKAQWSPHRSDCIAGLTMDGQVKIWKIKNFDVPADISTPQQYPEELFVHQAHDLMISDFAWCPYVEDVISTVSPGTVGSAGHIQVWRPRNLHESDDNGEP